MLGAVGQRAITWVNVDPEVCRHMASPVYNELTIRIHAKRTRCLKFKILKWTTATIPINHFNTANDIPIPGRFYSNNGLQSYDNVVMFLNKHCFINNKNPQDYNQ